MYMIYISLLKGNCLPFLFSGLTSAETSLATLSFHGAKPQ